MNISSVQLPSSAIGLKAGNSVRTSGEPANSFGRMVAKMTKNNEHHADVSKDERIGSLKAKVEDLLTAADVHSLTKAIKELTGSSQEKGLEALESLNQSSTLKDWTESLGLDLEELLQTITSILNESGITKEELAEVQYSNDIWSLIKAVSDYSPTLSTSIESMLSNGKELQQQAKDLLILLKSVETLLPTKDLLGWQETNLSQLSDQLTSLGESISSGSFSTDSKFSAFLTANPLESLKVGQTTGSAKSELGQLIQTMTNVTENRQEQAPNEGKSEQNQSQFLQNSSVQPIQSKNNFNLDSLETRPPSQSETLMNKLQGIFKQTNFGQFGGTNRLLIKLNPEQLGQIRIELIQMNGVMTARILASTSLGKEMLDSQLHQLRQSFAQQNIQVDRIDVTQAVQDPSRNDRSQNFSQHQFKGNPEQQEQTEQESEEMQSFQEFLVDLEV
ncbi:flagellar hook-length control protein FliK [Sporosarcina aquimarina]|uniref:Flagellar hook-length control protein FliK n=1 Tax=Sporosarcina aquimarina TaxID=114975 RepID=A0ABU4FWZ2_9BACL|nr:flagellar hook-length control protein FliK [Sporosarcina aquimarina]MDW0109227.1 flagellar hook-length control protein FliK [Sporosarcina aquimarina]